MNPLYPLDPTPADARPTKAIKPRFVLLILTFLLGAAYVARDYQLNAQRKDLVAELMRYSQEKVRLSDEARDASETSAGFKAWQARFADLDNQMDRVGRELEKLDSSVGPELRAKGIIR